MKKIINNIKRLDAVITTIILIIVIVVIFSVYVFRTGIEYKDVVSMYITLVAGGIGGVGTLIAVGLSNRETRIVQKNNNAISDRDYSLRLLDEYNKDCIELGKEIEDFMIKINEFKFTLRKYFEAVESDRNVLDATHNLVATGRKILLMSKCIKGVNQYEKIDNIVKDAIQVLNNFATEINTDAFYISEMRKDLEKQINCLMKFNKEVIEQIVENNFKEKYKERPIL